MSEKLDRRITMAIDLKKNRLRIHRSTLRIMGSPPFVKLLFSRDHNAIAVVSCDEGDIPRIKEVRVIYDLRDNTHTFDIYSKELILVIQMAFKGLDRTSLYRLTGYSVPEEKAVYFPLTTLTCMEDRHAVQETFIKAFRALETFRGDCSEKTWLTRIAINTCRDMRRGSWFRHIDRKASLEMLPEAAVQPAEEKLDLTIAVMNLPTKCREAIMLYYYQDMDTAEIGTILGIAHSSVSNRLRRGKNLLRKALEGRDQNV